MSKTGMSSVAIVAGLLLASPTYAGICELAGAGMTTAGTIVAGSSTAAGSFGVAALPHVSGSAILSSVGAGGTGYIAGTLGTLGAGALSIVSTPAVIVGAAGLAIVGGGTATYCYFSE